MAKKNMYEELLDIFKKGLGSLARATGAAAIVGGAMHVVHSLAAMGHSAAPVGTSNPQIPDLGDISAVPKTPISAPPHAPVVKSSPGRGIGI